MKEADIFHAIGCCCQTPIHDYVQPLAGAQLPLAVETQAIEELRIIAYVHRRLVSCRVAYQFMSKSESLIFCDANVAILRGQQTRVADGLLVFELWQDSLSKCPKFASVDYWISAATADISKPPAVRSSLAFHQGGAQVSQRIEHIASHRQLREGWLSGRGDKTSGGASRGKDVELE
jgi:hypothetical protein